MCTCLCSLQLLQFQASHLVGALLRLSDVQDMVNCSDCGPLFASVILGAAQRQCQQSATLCEQSTQCAWPQHWGLTLNAFQTAVQGLNSALQLALLWWLGPAASVNEPALAVSVLTKGSTNQLGPACRILPVGLPSLSLQVYPGSSGRHAPAVALGPSVCLHASPGTQGGVQSHRAWQSDQRW